MRAIASTQSHDRVSQNAAPYAVCDRILRSAFLIDLYGVRRRERPLFPRRTLRDDVRDLKDRVRVDGGLGRVA